jgi:hypothetical protein
VETGRLRERNLSPVLGLALANLANMAVLDEAFAQPIDGTVLLVFLVDSSAQSQFKMDSPARKVDPMDRMQMNRMQMDRMPMDPMPPGCTKRKVAICRYRNPLLSGEAKFRLAVLD